MEPRRRRDPYIQVTALAKFLSEPTACGYAAHFRAHFQYDRRPFDNAQWQLDHDALVTDQAALLRTEGYLVKTDEENDFRLVGAANTTVAGRPDLVAVLPGANEVLVVECKTGSPRLSDQVQARLYMLLLAYTRPDARAIPFAGQVAYRDSTLVDVPPVDDAFRAEVRAGIATLSGPQALPYAPGVRNCGYCDIPGCANRVRSADLAMRVPASVFT